MTVVRPSDVALGRAPVVATRSPSLDQAMPRGASTALNRRATAPLSGAISTDAAMESSSLAGLRRTATERPSGDQATATGDGPSMGPVTTERGASPRVRSTSCSRPGKATARTRPSGDRAPGPLAAESSAARRRPSPAPATTHVQWVPAPTCTAKVVDVTGWMRTSTNSARTERRPRAGSQAGGEPAGAGSSKPTLSTAASIGPGLAVSTLTDPVESVRRTPTPTAPTATIIATAAATREGARGDLRL